MKRGAWREGGADGGQARRDALRRLGTDAHHDTYREAVLALIEAKAGGESVVRARRSERPRTTSRRALEASLAALTGDGPAPKAKKAAAKAKASPRRSPTAKPGREGASEGAQVLMPRALWSGSLRLRARQRARAGGERHP